MKLFQSFVFFFLSSTILFAQDYATIYIEGDGVTPFYVKVEGVMQERLAKDYFIIPNLDAGYTNIEILFQQNIYPPQKFLIAIPNSGTRGFALKKINERKFSLYDLQQKRLIAADNKKVDDWVLEDANGFANQQAEQQVPRNTATSKPIEELPKFEPGRVKKAPKEVKKTTVAVEEAEQQPVFISGIELNKNEQTAGRNQQKEKAQVATKRRVSGNTKEDIKELPYFKLDENGNLIQPEKSNKVRTDLPAIPNTDCPDAMSNDKFEMLAIQFLDQQDDDSKLKFLRSKKNHCFSTEQVRILGKNMDTQSGRFEAVKSMYIQTSDQENFGKLEELFNTDFLKSKFRELSSPK